MAKRETKPQTQYIDNGFGFPIVLKDVTMSKIRGRWTPLVDLNVLAKIILKELAQFNGRITGNQVRFIRLQLEMTVQQFAERLGLTHPAILKWEKTGNKPTGMNWSTEKDIRLFVTAYFTGTAKEVFVIYKKLEAVAPARAVRLELDVAKLAA